MEQEVGHLVRRRERLNKRQPAALELLVGKDAYADTLGRVLAPWMLAVLVGSLAGVLLGVTPTPGYHRGAVAIVIAGSIRTTHPWDRS